MLVNMFYNSVESVLGEENTGRRLWKVIEDMVPNNIKTVLDAGCGSGYILMQFKEKGYVVEGIDLSEKSVEICRKRGLNVNQADVCRLPFPSNHFDLVVCTEVLEHIPDVKKAVKELTRVSDRYCIITIPYELGLFGVIKLLLRKKFVYEAENGRSYEYRHIHFFRLEDLLYLFNDPPLRVLRIKKCRLEYHPKYLPFLWKLFPQLGGWAFLIEKFRQPSGS